MMLQNVELVLMTSFYWTTTEERENRYQITSGGYYERVENNVPVSMWAGSEYVGFKTSTIPEVCMSESAAASLFAVIHNNGVGDYHIYETVSGTRQPDVDLTNSQFDFSLLEEVRFS
jgi:hypothetical protein